MRVPPENQAPTRSTHRQARVERIARVQAKLETLKGKKQASKRNLVYRVVRFIALFPVILGLGALAFVLKTPELFEWPLRLLASEVDGAVEANHESGRIEEAILEARADANEIGLEPHGLMMVEDATEADAGLSVVGEQD